VQDGQTKEILQPGSPDAERNYSTALYMTGLNEGGHHGKKLTTVYVNLLNEGTPPIRPTQAEILGENRYGLLATERYDPEDEEWEFVPLPVVTYERISTDKLKFVLLAIKQVK
jgi:hypothetical protein